ncbi:MAG: bifunctional diguanylate cyclase/phosphodiesterase [Acidimicrobiia bacterium]|nr:bifunctional diguanylate cyclase/phosphodiesterase [Acidimicrobiia bacterium]
MEHLSTVCRDITDRRRLEDQLSRHAFYDETTGLANRALLVEVLGAALRHDHDRGAIAVAARRPPTIRRGQRGARLRPRRRRPPGRGRRLTDICRPNDTVARHAGDVFAVLLDGLDDELDALAAARRIQSEVARPVATTYRELVLDSSIGLALTWGDTTDALELLRSAEVALSKAKESITGLAIFDPEMDERARLRLELENDLRQAIDSEQWRLAYQPIVDTAEHRVVSAEALLRWEHPEHGPISPAELIHSRSPPGSSCRSGGRSSGAPAPRRGTWQELTDRCSIAVNVSPRQLDEGFLDALNEVLEETGMDPDLLEIEITESVLAAHPSLIATVQDLRARGCTIAMDDFGTGYSSLAGLRELPIDVLKLDRTFVTHLRTSPRAQAAVRAVMGVARALDITVVAEGVEDADQLEMLTAMGCHRAQGFLLARPMPPEELRPLLAAGSRLPVTPG